MKVERKKRVLITEELVEKVLQLKAAGFSPSNIGRLLDISESAAGNIIRAGSFKNYKIQQAAYAKVKAERDAEKKRREEQAEKAWLEAEKEAETYKVVTETIPVVPNGDNTNEDIIEELKEVNIKLGQIVALLTVKDNSPNKPF